ncbi:MAG: XrtA system polysaccharide chain length determinant [Steroidobacteraceae bacterium]
MQEQLQQLVDYGRGMWRFRRAALTLSWAVCVLGWLVVLALPPVYEATSRVYVDATAVLRPLLEGIAVEQDVGAQVSFVRQAMLSRPQLERVARENDLFLDAVTAEEKDKVLTRLLEKISIVGANPDASRARREDADSLFTITYRSESRNSALNVVRTLVNSFVDQTLGGKRTGSESAQRFLERQIKEYDQRLGEAEARLAAFKKKYVGLAPGGQGDFFTRLQSEQDAIQRAQASLNVALNRRQVLERQIKGEQAFLATPSAGGGVGAQAGGFTTLTALKIQETEAHLQELLLRYTDKHPDVIATQETLDELRARQAQELEAMRRSAAAGQSVAGMTANPVYQQAQAQINAVDVEIAALRSELSVHQQNASQLRGLMDTAPEAEAEYARLMRDYDVVKAQYNELVSRLDRARISEDAEQTGVVRFEIIDPPTVSLNPVAPKRPLLVVVVLIGGLLAGAGLAFALNQLHPVFDNVRSLGEVTALPVLGAVSRIWRERHRVERTQEVIRVAIASVLLFGVFAGVLILQGPVSRLFQTLIG